MLHPKHLVQGIVAMGQPVTALALVGLPPQSLALGHMPLPDWKLDQQLTFRDDVLVATDHLHTQH